MTDTRTVWDVAKGRGDIQLSGTQLLTGNDLETAALISLFTDGTASDDDLLLDGTGDPRGWWGDVQGEPSIGSRLWLLDRAKQTNSVLLAARDYCVQALQWMIDDGVAAKIDVLAEYTRPSMLGIHITIHRTDGTTVALNFAWAWTQEFSNAV